MELTMTGRQISAEEARIGPGQPCLQAGRVDGKSAADRKGYHKEGPVALELTKDTILRGQDMDLDNACALESKAFGLSFSTEDQKEGMAAFMEKRSPEFHGG